MTAFDIEQINLDILKAKSPYFEFLRKPSMSMGLYVLETGGKDLQTPHSEDEAYFVLEGRGKFTQNDEHINVSSGSIIFVPAFAEHRFHSVTENLRILVFFAPAEYSMRNQI